MCIPDIRIRTVILAHSTRCNFVIWFLYLYTAVYKTVTILYSLDNILKSELFMPTQYPRNSYRRSVGRKINKRRAVGNSPRGELTDVVSWPTTNDQRQLGRRLASRDGRRNTSVVEVSSRGRPPVRGPDDGERRHREVNGEIYQYQYPEHQFPFPFGRGLGGGGMLTMKSWQSEIQWINML